MSMIPLTHSELDILRHRVREVRREALLLSQSLAHLRLLSQDLGNGYGPDHERHYRLPAIEAVVDSMLPRFSELANELEARLKEAMAARVLV